MNTWCSSRTKQQQSAYGTEQIGKRDGKVGAEYSQETNLVNKQALNSDFQSLFANIVGQREPRLLKSRYWLPTTSARAKVVDLQASDERSIPRV